MDCFAALAGFLLTALLIMPAAALPQLPAPQVTLEGDLGDFKSGLVTQQLEDGLFLATVSLQSEKAAKPPKFRLKWSVPSFGVEGFWNTRSRINRGNYYNNRLTTRISSGDPVLLYFDQADNNAFNFAVSDALNQVQLSAYLREEDARFYCQVECFTEPVAPLSNYSVTIRIDHRRQRYEAALGEVAAWWRDLYPPAQVPEAARLPVYSTWYNYHQSLDPDLLLKELQASKTLGMDVVIIDDGWQTNDSARGYKFTGDWKPERLTELPQLVEKIHQAGVKVMLWYSLPFVGTGAENYERFKGKYLRTFGSSKDTWVLDPRYPETREFIIGTYENAMREWNIDGFKLDFIGWFKAGSDTVFTSEDGRDFSSVNEAVDHLMTQVRDRLRKINPEVLLEFRQPYAGPVMRTYGNMMRGVDCPNNAVANRVETIDLRLLAGPTAVHSDMTMWHSEAPVEDAARQLLACLYSVPQVSILVTKFPAEHKQMVTFWLDYWRKHREILLDGTLRAYGPVNGYPLVTAAKNGALIATVYQNTPVEVGPEVTELHLVNATARESLIVSGAMAGMWQLTTTDCLGNVSEKQVLSLKADLTTLDVPISGLVQLKRMKKR